MQQTSDVEFQLKKVRKTSLPISAVPIHLHMTRVASPASQACCWNIWNTTLHVAVLLCGYVKVNGFTFRRAARWPLFREYPSGERRFNLNFRWNIVTAEVDAWSCCLLGGKWYRFRMFREFKARHWLLWNFRLLRIVKYLCMFNIQYCIEIPFIKKICSRSDALSFVQPTLVLFP